MLNPILAFSATRRMRSFRTLLIAAAWLIAMLTVVLLVMGSLFGSQVSIRSLRSGVNGYLALMIVQFALIVLIAPAMTSGSIAGERERQTLELLLVTNTRSFRIVAGKAMESFAMLALLIVCDAGRSGNPAADPCRGAVPDGGRFRGGLRRGAGVLADALLGSRRCHQLPDDFHDRGGHYAAYDSGNRFYQRGDRHCL